MQSQSLDLCKDELDATFTSCYNLVDGATTTVVATAGGTYTVGTSTSDYEYSDADYAAGKCNLDNGNGAIHPTTGQYSYFMTTGYPWVPTIYYGNSGSSNLCSAAQEDFPAKTLNKEQRIKLGLNVI